MAELAGKINIVYILTGATPMLATTGAKINGVNSSTYNRLAEILETTQFGDDYKKRMAGLKDTSVSLSGNYDPDDTAGQLDLEPGDFVYVGIYPEGTGTTGKQAPMVIESFEQSSSADGKQEFSSSLSGNGAPETLPAQT